MFARHAGARRFAYNQCLALVHEALEAKRADPGCRVPWSRFSLINAFNTWKRSATAGLRIAVSLDGNAEVIETGLAWRHGFAGVFEEAAADLARAFAAYWESRAGQRPGPRVGFPVFKRKSNAKPTFRLRNRAARGASPTSGLGRTSLVRSPCRGSDRCGSERTPGGYAGCCARGPTAHSRLASGT